MDNVEEFKNVRVGFLHKEKGCRCDSMSRGRKFPLTKFLLRSPEYTYLIREISAIPPDHEVVFIIILIKNLKPEEPPEWVKQNFLAGGTIFPLKAKLRRLRGQNFMKFLT